MYRLSYVLLFKTPVILEQSIEQLFLRYLQNRATATEIEQVISMIAAGGYEEEWKAALSTFEAEFTAAIPVTMPDEQALFQRISAKISQQRKVHSLRWIGYAASILTVLTFGYLFWRTAAPTTNVPGSKLAHVTAKKSSGRKWIKLPDGSSVQLNSDSHLDYPESFQGKERVVRLTGEAFFDIRHDEHHPFIIHTGKIKTTVLGTAFNIRSDAAGKNVTVTVTRGKVMVQEAGRTLGVLIANEQLSWQMEKLPFKRRVNAAEVVAWKNQDLIMDDITLAQAAELIAQRYQLKVTFANEHVKHCRFTAAFLNRNDIEQVIAVLADITGASFELQGKQLFIGGQGC